MRRNSDFVLRQVVGKFVVIPLGQAAESFRGIITLNKTGKFLWDLLETEQTEESLINALIATYGITEERAAGTVKKLLESICPTGAIEK